MKKIFVLAVILSCFYLTGTSAQQKHKSKKFTIAAWVDKGKGFDEKKWVERLDHYRDMGISEILVQGEPDFYRKLIPLAKKRHIKVHAWILTLNRPNDTVANKHPDWYAVNRKGQNSLDYRAYVDYYQWLSPFSPGAREYVKSNIRKLAEVKGLESIHLDYVRYVDVILGADLQPKYKLVQDRQMPEYDYGYHPLAREGYKKIFGVDPMEMEHPELSTEWLQYRLNAVTTLVNELVEIAHIKKIKMSAAVFPFPEMSRQMVRQAWNDWNLDMVYPMLYNNFYRQGINWIGFATKQDVSDVDFPVYSGLFMPALKEDGDLEKAILTARQNGASGITLFTADNLTKEQVETMKKLKNTLK